MSSKPANTPFFFPFLLLFLLLAAARTRAHGHLDWPNPRGALNGNHNTERIDRTAPNDYHIHFPAGSKSVVPGSALRSQERTGRHKWTPFEPLKRNFRWRAGVCGDLRHRRNPSRGDHMRGGKFYYPKDSPRIVHVFRPGDILNASSQIVAHHNGFFEFHLCDVRRCGGEISESCFRSGHCRQLQRARTPECQSGNSQRCGPIDEQYPGRWYLPCSASNNDRKFERFGPDTMEYIIPNDIQCTHCVLHWFWSAANTCNPPGVLEYFDGEYAPRWGNCKGQGGAIGGVARQQRPCEGSRFPEEYYQCADIAVMGEPTGVTTGAGKKRRPTPISSPSPTSTPHVHVLRPPGGHGSFGKLTGLFLVSRGRRVARLYTGDVVNVAGMEQLTFEAKAAQDVSSVRFRIRQGRMVLKSTTEHRRPFRMFQGRRTPFWDSVVYDKTIVVTAKTDGDTDRYRIRLVR